MHRSGKSAGLMPPFFEKEENMKKTLSILLILAMMLAAFAGCGNANKEPERSPLEKTFQALTAEYTAMKPVVPEKIKGATFKLDLAPEDMFQQSIHMELLASETQQVSGSLSLNVAGMEEPIQASVYADASNLAFNLSNVGETWYGVALEGLLDQLDNSVLAPGKSSLSLDEETYGMMRQSVEEFVNSMNSMVADNKAEEKADQMLESVKTALDKVGQTIVKTTSTVTVDDYQAEKTTYVINTNTVIKLLDELKELILNNTEIRAMAEQLMPQITEATEGEITTLEEAMEMVDAVKPMLSMYAFEIEASVYTYQGYATKLELVLSMNAGAFSGVEGAVAMTEMGSIVLDFGKAPSGENGMKLTLTAMGQELFSLTVKTVKNGDAFTTTADITVNVEGEENTVSLTFSWNKKTGDYNFQVLEGEETVFALEGVWLAKKDGFQFSLKQLTYIETSYDWDGEDIVEIEVPLTVILNLSLEIKYGEVTVTKPVYSDVLAMTEDQFTEMVFAFYGAFGDEMV